MTRTQSLILKAFDIIKTWFIRLGKKKRKKRRIRFTVSTYWRDIEKNGKIDNISINPFVNYINQFKKYCERYQQGLLELTDGRAKECLLCETQLQRLITSNNDEKVLREQAHYNWYHMTAKQKEPFIAFATKKRNWFEKKGTALKSSTKSKRFQTYARNEKSIAPAGLWKRAKRQAVANNKKALKGIAKNGDENKVDATANSIYFSANDKTPAEEEEAVAPVKYCKRKGRKCSRNAKIQSVNPPKKQKGRQRSVKIFKRNKNVKMIVGPNFCINVDENEAIEGQQMGKEIPTTGKPRKTAKKKAAVIQPTKSPTPPKRRRKT